VYIPRRWGLGCLNLAEQLGEDPDEVVVVDGAEDLGNEGAALGEELDGKPERHEHELGLRVRVLDPRRANVWRAVVQHDVRAPVFELTAEERAAVWGRDVGRKCRDAWDWPDGHKVNACIGEA
jgi:hypothetical protein